MRVSDTSEETFWHLLARVWSAVAFFHPWVEGTGLAWEGNLVSIFLEAEAVAHEPILSAAQRRLLASLVNTVGDHATRLRANDAGQPAGRVGSGKPWVTVRSVADGIVHVQVRDWFDFRIGPGYFAEWNRAIRALTSAIVEVARAGSAGLILDFRETRGEREEDEELGVVFGQMRQELVAHLIDEPVIFPDLARLQRIGYHDPENPGGAFGAYRTEWVVRSGQMVAPADTAFHGPVALLTASDTSSLLEPALLALQRSGRAVGVGQQSLAYHPSDHVLHLTEEFDLRLRQYALFSQGLLARYVPDASTDDALTAALAILKGPKVVHPTSRPPVAPFPVSSPRRQPAANDFPPRAERIASILKLWSAVRAFSPDPTDLLVSWDSALPVAVDEAASAATSAEYFGACQRLLAHRKGGHSFVLFREGTETRFARWPHGYAPPVRLVRQEEGIVVVGPIEEWRGIRSGDILEAIDGEPVAAREKRLRPLLANFPAGAIDHYLLPALLDHPKGASVCLRLRHSANPPREVVLVADHPVAFVSEPVAVQSLPAWCVLPGFSSPISYLDVSRANLNTLPTALQDLAEAAAIVVDLRRYPSLPNPIVSLRPFIRYRVPWPPQQRPVVIAPEQGIFGWLENRFFPTDVVTPVEIPDLRPLAALIGGGTVSLGEDWARLLKRGCGAILVGSTTAGGVGANAFVNLPGGGRASFSGSRAFAREDGRSIDGFGIEPDLVAQQRPGDDGDSVLQVAAEALLVRLMT